MCNWVTDCDCFSGVPCAPEKDTVCDCLDSWAECASLAETKVMEDPESNSALATTCLPPGPCTRTLLVIIRQLGGLETSLDDWSELTTLTFTLTGLAGRDGSGAWATSARTFTDAVGLLSLWIRVLCFPLHCLNLPQLLQSRP